MIYSINESFFSKKPNKYAIENAKDLDKAVKTFLKYFSECYKLITSMGGIVSKDNFTDSDTEKVDALYKKWSDLNEILDELNQKDRNLAFKLLKVYGTKEYCEEDLPDSVTQEYKTFHKKICKNGEYIKQFMQHSRNLFKQAERYDDLRKKYDHMDTSHKTACEKYGGFIGTMIGSIPFYNPFKKLPEGMKED